jgi:hypothetical protein
MRQDRSAGFVREPVRKPDEVLVSGAVVHDEWVFRGFGLAV